MRINWRTNMSLSHFSQGILLLWYAVLVLKCYTLSSLPYFLYLNFGLILFQFIIAPRVQIFGGMMIDSFITSMSRDCSLLTWIMARFKV